MDFKSLRVQITEVRDVGNNLIQKLTMLINSLPSAQSPANTTDAISRLLEQILSTAENDLSLAEMKEQKTVEARVTLEKFLRVVPPSESTVFLLEKHKSGVLECLRGEKNEIEEFVRPYALFVSLVESPSMDLSLADGDSLDEVFGRECTRPLYQGKFTFMDDGEVKLTEDTIKLPEHVDDQITKTSLSTESAAIIAPSARELQYSFETEKASFSVKAFLSDHADRSDSGRLIPKLDKIGALLLLDLFARCGVLSRSQIEKFLYGKWADAFHLDRLLKDGLITKLTHKNTGAEFFALSNSGVEVFKKEKSRVMMGKLNRNKMLSGILNAERAVEYMEAFPEAYSRILSVTLYIFSKNFGSLIQGVSELKSKDPFVCLSIDSDAYADGLVGIFPYSDRLIESESFLETAKNLSMKKLIIAAGNEKPSFPFSAEFCGNFNGEIYFSQVLGTKLAVKFFAANGTNLTLKELFSPTSSSPTIEKNPQLELDAKPSVEVKVEAKVDKASAEVVYNMDNPFVLAEQMLDNCVPAERNDLFEALSDALLQREATASPGDVTDYLGRAVVLNKTLAMADEVRYGDNYRCLSLATDFRLDTCRYTGEELIKLFSGEREGTAMHLAALLRALFAPDLSFDYQLDTYASDVFARYDDIFPNFCMLKSTLNDFLTIGDATREGFSNAIIGHFLDGQNKERTIDRLKNEAERLKNSPNINQKLKGLPEALNECFGAGSELGKCMKTVAENNVSEREFVLTAYEDFTDGERIAQDKIISAFDSAWGKTRRNSSEPIVPKIVGPVRRKILEAFQERLIVADQWLGYTKADKGDNIKLKDVYEKITSALLSAKEAVAGHECLSPKDRAIFQRSLNNMSSILEGNAMACFKPEDWLSCGVFSIDRTGAPRIEEIFSRIRYHEPWRNALRHIARKPQDLRETLEYIDDMGNETFYDNFGQAIAICEHLERNGESTELERYCKSINNAEKFAEDKIKKFKGELERDFFYGRVSEYSKETTLNMIEDFKPEFWETHDFARFRAFLSALRHSISDEISENRARWESNIRERRQNDYSAGMDFFLNRAEHFLTNGNADFGLVEDALNNFDSKAEPGAPESIHDEGDLFADFTAEENFSALFDICKRNKMGAFSAFALAYVKDKIEKAGLSTQYVNSAQKLVRSLPNKPEENGENGVRTLLEELGFTVNDVKRENPGKSPSHFIVSMKPDITNRSSYNHPIAEAGTRLPRRFDIIEFFGSVEPAAIVDGIRNFELRNMSIVLLNGTLDLGQRRRLAERFLKDSSRQAPFALLDWPLLLHLAIKIKTDRMRTMLACTLPYSGAKQLFTQTGSLADEMFIGRTQELRQILDMNGPVIIYGGRQLGKTALLERARNLFNSPSNNEYSVLVNAVSCRDERSFAEAVVKELSAAGLALADVGSVKQLCEELREKFDKGECNRALLLFDETDAMLASFSEYDRKYEPLEALADLRRRTNNRFKFIFAGLHNVFIAAQYPNSIFGQFGKPLCIRPMSQSDAYKLLSRPLKYLGFRVDKNLLERLLVSTNFYPGIVHFVGAKIIELLTQKYAEYYSAEKNPPYDLNDQQIGAIMNSFDLSKMINDRILWTLQVDPSYFMLACCIAYLCYENRENRRYDYRVSEILEYAELLEIKELAAIKEEECSQLLTELCEMSILVEKDGSYRFRQGRFLQIIGKNLEEVEVQIKRIRTVNENGQ